MDKEYPMIVQLDYIRTPNNEKSMEMVKYMVYQQMPKNQRIFLNNLFNSFELVDDKLFIF